jgi:hypothetical protein
MSGHEAEKEAPAGPKTDLDRKAEAAAANMGNALIVALLLAGVSTIALIATKI